jgi:hypothetical protein
VRYWSGHPGPDDMKRLEHGAPATLAGAFHGGRLRHADSAGSPPQSCASHGLFRRTAYRTRLDAIHLDHAGALGATCIDRHRHRQKCFRTLPRWGHLGTVAPSVNLRAYLSLPQCPCADVTSHDAHSHGPISQEVCNCHSPHAFHIRILSHTRRCLSR